MAAKYPLEFREDVVRVALAREDGVGREQIAKDFGIHVGTLDKWIRQHRIDTGTKDGVSTAASAKLRGAHRQIRLLEQENEVLRRAAAYLSQANLPSKGFTRS